jgi:hypothetical protein
MKTILNVKLAFLSIAVVALTFGHQTQALAQAESSLPSTVVRMTGQARGSADNGKTWKPLKVGHILRSGTLVQTAKRADLDIVLGEQVAPSATDAFYNPDARPANFLSLSSDTLLKLDKVVSKAAADSTASEEILLELRTGEVTGNVKKITGDSKYEISFIGGVAGTREGIYKLNANGQMTVLKGKAFVASADGNVKEYAAGEQVTPKNRRRHRYADYDNLHNGRARTRHSLNLTHVPNFYISTNEPSPQQPERRPVTPPPSTPPPSTLPHSGLRRAGT